MTIDDVLTDERRRQQEFPVSQTRVFLGHAAVCALPHRVAQAMADCAFGGTREDQESFVGQTLYQTREQAARMLGADLREIALVGPTSLALSFIAAGLDFQPGDNVICYQDDYPSNVYPWLALQEIGVEIRYVQTESLGRIEPDDVFSIVDERTRLVALASCHFISGWRIDLETIGSELRKRGVLFCVDAIQTVGAMPTSVEHVDFLAADSLKWMLGPCSAGIMYVRKEVQDRMKPTTFGWHNVECPDFITRPDIELKQDARRYEAGTHNLIGIVGMKAALDLLLEAGIENIQNELLRKRAFARDNLLAKGWTVVGADSDDANCGGMLSFHRERTNLGEIQKILAAKNITVSLRKDRTQKSYLRISPHFYNTDEELNRLFELL
jgi:cysteine desulfurase/selenocysteine lyase